MDSGSQHWSVSRSCIANAIDAHHWCASCVSNTVLEFILLKPSFKIWLLDDLWLLSPWNCEKKKTFSIRFGSCIFVHLLVLDKLTENFTSLYEQNIDNHNHIFSFSWDCNLNKGKRPNQNQDPTSRWTWSSYKRAWRKGSCNRGREEEKGRKTKEMRTFNLLLVTSWITFCMYRIWVWKYVSKTKASRMKCTCHLLIPTHVWPRDAEVRPVARGLGGAMHPQICLKVHF